jgi:hypothetical protein
MRLVRFFPVLALVASLAACNDVDNVLDDVRDIVNDLPPPVFEDVGDDPHPPRLTLLAIGVGVPDPEPPPPEPAPARSVTYFPPDAVVTVRPYYTDSRTLVLRVAFADAGADLSSITVRDLDGPNSGSFELPELPVTSGVGQGALDFDPNSVPGPHRFEIWAEDGKESRSAKITFTVNVESY